MDVSIVIVNYNTKDLLDQCIDSIIKNVKEIEYEIIVTDNNSSDGSISMLKNKYPEVKTIESKINGGFAYANNLAIKKSTGRYVFLLNSDTIILEDVVQKMLNYMDENSWVGILGPELLNADLSHQTSISAFPTFFREIVHIYEFKKVLNYKFMRKFFIKYGGKLGSKDIEQYMKNYQSIQVPEKVQVLVGAAMLIRRKVIEDIGGLDESYFMYYEEIDYCYQALKANWPCVYYPYGQIIHLIGQSSKKINDITFYARYRSMIYYFRKNHGSFKEYLVRLNLVIGLAWRLIRDYLKQIVNKNVDYKLYSKMYKNTIKIALGLNGGH